MWHQIFKRITGVHAILIQHRNQLKSIYMKNQTSVMVSLDQLIPNPKNPYKSSEADRKSIAASIRENGVENPIVIVPITEMPGKYRINQGHRRFAGANDAGLKEIPAFIREFQSEDEEMLSLLIGNESRRKSEYEIAMEIFLWKGIMSRKQGYRSDLELLTEPGQLSTSEKLAVKFLKSEATIDKYLFILEHKADLFDMVDRGLIRIEGAYNIAWLIFNGKLPAYSTEDVLMMQVIEIANPALLGQIERGDMDRKDAFTTSVRSLSRLKKTKPAKETEPSSEPLQIEEPKKEVAAEAITTGEIESPAVEDEEQLIEETGTETGANSTEAQATGENGESVEGASDDAEESEEKKEEADVEETKVVTMPDTEPNEDHFCQIESCACFGKVVRVVGDGRTAA
jgi:hypothetical protein